MNSDEGAMAVIDNISERSTNALTVRSFRSKVEHLCCDALNFILKSPSGIGCRRTDCTPGAVCHLIKMRDTRDWLDNESFNRECFCFMLPFIFGKV